jgi:glycosyltransferase involved in cell wall biosynthesis
VNQVPVSVIICAYTEERLKDIHEAVESVLIQTVKAHEVILAVDNNEELSRRLRSELPSRVSVVLNNRTPGLSETRNVGIRSSTGQIVAFIDDDAIAEATWLSDLVAGFDDPRVMAVGGQALPLWPRGKPPFWFPEEFDFVIGCTGHKKLMVREGGEVRNVTGSNMAFRRAVFEKAGMWETTLGRCDLGRKRFNPSGGEEAELCLRIVNSLPGSVILFRPESVVKHKVVSRRATLRYVLDFCFREGHTRATVKKVVAQYDRNPLRAESIFLRRLILGSVPQRLLRFYKVSNLAQVAVIGANLSAMAAGYVLGRWIYR